MNFQIITNEKDNLLV